MVSCSIAQPSGTLSKLVNFSSTGAVEGACHQDGIHDLQLNIGGYEDMETCLADWLNSLSIRIQAERNEKWRMGGKSGGE